eukprot:UN03215
MMMSVCSVIELFFALLILYGVTTYKIWCIWVALLWTGLHGVTILYSLIKWHNNPSIMLYFFAMIIVFWISAFLFNIMYFIKLNAAGSSSNSVITETKDTDANLKGLENHIKMPGTPLDESVDITMDEFDEIDSLHSS